MKILAIDTSGLVAAVAVSDGDKLISQFTVQHKVTHSQILMPMMEDIKKMTDMDLNSIDAIAVSKGPGSFTGLRIGAATAKGLALALDKPLIAVPTIDALAYNLYGHEDIICPMMDARRSQVYTGLYTFFALSKEISESEISFDMKVIKEQLVTSIEDIAEQINSIGKRTILLGDGVPVYMERLKSLLKVPFFEAPYICNRQSAASVALLAAKYYEEGIRTDTDSFAPCYLRPSQAERAANDGSSARKKTAVKERIMVSPMTRENLETAAALEKKYLGCEAWNIKQLETAAFDRDDTIYLVAKKQDEVIGLCGIQNISGEGEITNVSVDKACRHEGVAYKMLRQLMERAQGIGVNSFTLEVRASNAAAIRLYEKLGFKSEGVRPGFYDAPKDDAVIYWIR